MLGDKKWQRYCCVLFLVAFLAPLPSHASCSDRPGPGIDWSKCEKEKRRLGGEDLSGGHFLKTDLSGSDLSEANLSHSHLIGANLTRTNLQGANLEGADLTKALGGRASFKGAELKNAVLAKAELPRADFSETELAGTDLTKADLARANMTGSRLTDVELKFANLSRAKLQGAVVVASDFGGAYTYLMRIEGADLSQAQGLTQDQLDIACGNDSSKLPAGLQVSDQWPCDWE